MSLSRLSEELPTPKSSSEIATPALRNWASVVWAVVMSAMRPDSVISSTS
jgi:hypothetical protein